MTINEPMEVADQTTDQRTLLPDAIELVRAAEQLVDDGFVMLLDAVVVEQANGAGAVQTLRVCGCEGERT